MADLTGKTLANGYPNLVTIGATTNDNPTSGTLENGKGNNLTSVTFDGAVVVNESGGNNDFRVEGDTEANLIFADASADAVGIGTNTPTAPLSFGKSVYGQPTVENFFRIKLQDPGGANNDTGIGQTESGALGLNCAADKEIEFFAGTRGKLASFVSLGGSKYLRMASGTDGIQFGGDTASANALDDYEEGTWTPVYEPGTGSFTTMTMDVQSATYTKIGIQVTVRAYIGTNNVDATGASGSLRISGLPFASSANGWSAISVGLADSFVNSPDSGFVRTGESVISLRKTNATIFSDVGDLTTGALASENRLILTATYFV